LWLSKHVAVNIVGITFHANIRTQSRFNQSTALIYIKSSISLELNSLEFKKIDSIFNRDRNETFFLFRKKRYFDANKKKLLQILKYSRLYKESENHQFRMNTILK
jgi:hypothetical protein